MKKYPKNYVPLKKSPSVDPLAALESINKALANSIGVLHEAQGMRGHGSVHLMVTKIHEPHCYGCPHYVWVIWQLAKARTGIAIGGQFFKAIRITSPARTQVYKDDKKLPKNKQKPAKVIDSMMKLLEQRTNLVASISRAERSAQATVKLVRHYI